MTAKNDEKKLADARLQGLGMQKDTNIKQEREKFAVSLRKDRREEAMEKRRKTFLGPVEMPASEDITAQLGVDVASFTIDNAFACCQQHQMGLEPFISNIATKMKFQKPDLARLVKLIHSSDNFEKLFALVGLRKLLSIEDDPPIEPIIAANLIQMFVELLSHEIPKFSFEAAWCLTNIASGKTEHVYALIEKDVIPSFIKLLNSPVPEVVD